MAHRLPILLPLFQKLPGHPHIPRGVKKRTPRGWTSRALLFSVASRSSFFCWMNQRTASKTSNLKQLHWLPLPQDPLFRSLIYQDYGRNIFSKFQIWEFWTILMSLKRLHQLPVWIKHSKLWLWGKWLGISEAFLSKSQENATVSDTKKSQQPWKPWKNIVNSSACLEKTATPKNLQKQALENPCSTSTFLMHPASRFQGPMVPSEPPRSRKIMSSRTPSSNTSFDIYTVCLKKWRKMIQKKYLHPNGQQQKILKHLNFTIVSLIFVGGSWWPL